MHSIAYRGLNKHHKRVCTRSWLWEKYPLPHLGLESNMHQQCARPNMIQPTELHLPQKTLEASTMGTWLGHGFAPRQDTQYGAYHQQQNVFPNTYTLHGNNLQDVSSTMYLGLILWSDARFNQHIQFHGIITKESQTLAILRRNLETRSKQLRASPANLWPGL